MPMIEPLISPEMKCLVLGALLLVAGCGNRQAAEDAALVREAQELIALTEGQLPIREKLVAALAEAKASEHEQEVARLELDATRLELKMLRAWLVKFDKLRDAGDAERLERHRGQFRPLVIRLR